MFKKGQVIKCSSTGFVFVIHEEHGDFPMVRAIVDERMLSVYPEGKVFSVNATTLELIGNNYKPKRVNKALTEVRA